MSDPADAHLHARASHLARASAWDALEHEQIPYRTVANAHPTVLWLADENGSVTHKSHAWSLLTGQTPDEALGYGWLERVHPSDRERVREAGVSAIARGERFVLEYRVLTPTGGERWVRDVGQPIHDANGRTLGHCGAITDVHELVVQRERLREREEHLERMAGIDPEWWTPHDGLSARRSVSIWQRGTPTSSSARSCDCTARVARATASSPPTWA